MVLRQKMETAAEKQTESMMWGWGRWEEGMARRKSKSWFFPTRPSRKWAGRMSWNERSNPSMNCNYSTGFFSGCINAEGQKRASAEILGIYMIYLRPVSAIVFEYLKCPTVETPQRKDPVEPFGSRATTYTRITSCTILGSIHTKPCLLYKTGSYT